MCSDADEGNIWTACWKMLGLFVCSNNERKYYPRLLGLVSAYP